MDWLEIVLCGFLFGLGLVGAAVVALFLLGWLNRFTDWYDYRRATRYTRR